MARNPAEEVTVANQVKPSAATPSLVDQYNLGDTEPASEIDENADTEAQFPGATQAVTSEAPAVDDAKTVRPRAADGTFLPKDAAPAPPALPTRLTRMAEELGFSEDDLAGASKEQVEDWIFAANKSQMKAKKAESILNATERRPQPSDVLAPSQAEVADEFDTDEFRGLAENGYPQLVERLKAQDARIKQLEAHVQGLGQAERHRQVQTFAEKFDAVIDKLAMPHVFGSGPRDDLDPEGLEFKRRVKVIEEMERDKSKKPFEQKVKAAAALFGYAHSQRTQALSPVDNNGPSPAQRAEKNGHDDFEEEWTQAALARPTNRMSAEPKGDRKAVATARKYMAANGLLNEDEANKDGFLE